MWVSLAICLCFPLTKGHVFLGLGWEKRGGKRNGEGERSGQGEGVALDTIYEGPHTPFLSVSGEVWGGGGGIRIMLVIL